jgi:hypothetical protein
LLIRENIDAKEQMNSALRGMAGKYDALVAVATIILIETLRLKRGRSALGIQVKELASLLAKSISINNDRLSRDKTGSGAECPDGLLGELRRLSNNTVNLGGPSFCT